MTGCPRRKYSFQTGRIQRRRRDTCGTSEDAFMVMLSRHEGIKAASAATEARPPGDDHGCRLLAEMIPYIQAH